MTRADILQLDTGDSVIGLRDTWDDELPVVCVGELLERAGRLCRTVVARQGRRSVAAVVREGDTTIRGARI